MIFMSKTVMSDPLLTPPHIDQCYQGPVNQSVLGSSECAISQLVQPLLELSVSLKDGLVVTGEGSTASHNDCQMLHFCEHLNVCVVHVKIGNFLFPWSCLAYIVRPALAPAVRGLGGDYSGEQKHND